MYEEAYMDLNTAVIVKGSLSKVAYEKILASSKNVSKNNKIRARRIKANSKTIVSTKK